MDYIVLPLEKIDDMHNNPIAIGYYVKAIRHSMQSHSPFRVVGSLDKMLFGMTKDGLDKSIKMVEDVADDFNFSRYGDFTEISASGIERFTLSDKDYNDIKHKHPF